MSEEILYTRCTTKGQLEEILALQKANLPQSVSDSERKTEGFVTVHHDYNLLEEMNDECPHIIAIDDSEVVGYALCMHPKFRDRIPVLFSMFEQIDALELPYLFIVMGQICIAKSHRKRGIFRSLYNNMLQVVQPQFEAIITEVDATNPRSMKAHYAIGFERLKTYSANNRDWELIVLR